MSTRTSIPRGPAIVQYNGGTFLFPKGITVEPLEEFFQVPVGYFAEGDERTDTILHKITGVPDGRWTNLSALFPYYTKVIGSSVFGADTSLTVWSIDGKVKRVYKAAAVTKMPDLDFSAKKTLMTEVEFTCIHGEDEAWSTADSLFTETEDAFPGIGSYDATDIVTQPYGLQWLTALTVTADASTDVFTTSGLVPPDGTIVRFTNSGGALPGAISADTDYYVRDSTATTFKVSTTRGGSAVNVSGAGTGTHTATTRFNDFHAALGVSVQHNLTLQKQEVDHKGIYDMSFAGLSVKATLLPHEPAQWDIMAARRHQGRGAVRGRSKAEYAGDLNIVGTGVYFRLYNAAMGNGKEFYGPDDRRVQPIEFTAVRSFVAGEAVPLAYVGTSAPA